jgi:hypothetical protein
MNIKVRNYLEIVLDDYSKLSESSKFHYYFNIRGNERIRRDFNRPGYGFSSDFGVHKSLFIDRNLSDLIFLRIFKKKYDAFVGGSGVFDESLLSMNNING